MLFKCAFAALPPLGQGAPLGTEPVSVRPARGTSESGGGAEVLLSEGAECIPPGLASAQISDLRPFVSRGFPAAQQETAAPWASSLLL